MLARRRRPAWRGCRAARRPRAGTPPRSARRRPNTPWRVASGRPHTARNSLKVLPLVDVLCCAAVSRLRCWRTRMAQGLAAMSDFSSPRQTGRFDGFGRRGGRFSGFPPQRRSAGLGNGERGRGLGMEAAMGGMIFAETTAAPADRRRHGDRRQHAFFVEGCRTAAGPGAAGAGAPAGRRTGVGAGGAAGQGPRRLPGAGDVAGAGGGGGVRARVVGVAAAGVAAQPGAAGDVRVRSAGMAAGAGADAGAGRAGPGGGGGVSGSAAGRDSDGGGVLAVPVERVAAGGGDGAVSAMAASPRRPCAGRATK